MHIPGLGSTTMAMPIAHISCKNLIISSTSIVAQLTDFLPADNILYRITQLVTIVSTSRLCHTEEIIQVSSSPVAEALITN